MGLEEAVNAKLRTLPGNKPMELQSDVPAVNDTGPFGRYGDPLIDEKRMHIYLQEENTDHGIDPWNAKYGMPSLEHEKVIKP